jgi:nicotinamide phosphoribosyltransferase
MSGIEDAASSGAAHPTSSCGTDTVPAIDLIEVYDNGDSEKELIGCSVSATEHSVMCMGTCEGEMGTICRLITHLYPAGIVSIVSDTWDSWQVITEFTVALKPEIPAREGKLVFRRWRRWLHEWRSSGI